MSDRIVPILLTIVLFIALLNAYVFITPNYVMVSIKDGEIDRYATMYTQGGCQEILGKLVLSDVTGTQYKCIRISDVRP